jgi:hypothetical protein
MPPVQQALGYKQHETRRGLQDALANRFRTITSKLRRSGVERGRSLPMRVLYARPPFPSVCPVRRGLTSLDSKER